LNRIADQPPGLPAGEDGAAEGAEAADAKSPDPAAPDPGDSERHRTQDRSHPREAGIRAARRAAEGESSLTSMFVFVFVFESLIN
jgi:hypothetical protein